jgi:membrane protease YdiL (CAAX protease family)
VVAFALVAIAAPFAEEIAFRGIVLPALGDRLGMWWGIGITSLLYAGFHASLWMIVPTAVLGVALGWLTWTRRSLWPAVALHVLYNATAVAAAFVTAG